MKSALALSPADAAYLAGLIDGEGTRSVSPAHAPGLTYSVSNRQALSVLRQAEPYLRSYKRCRARLVLDRYVRVTPRNGRYTNELEMRRCEFEDVFAAISPSG